MSQDVILFLVEGDKEISVTNQISELNQTDSLKLLPKGKNIVYGTTIYGLYKEIKEYLDDELDFDLFPILMEITKRKKNSVLDGLTKHDISQVYLLFDYDPHATNFSEEKIKTMCEIFNNEYTIGKLFINYPMIEVFRHCYKLTKAEQSFLEVTCPVPKLELKNYKKYVSNLLPDFTKIDCNRTIKKVIIETIIKSNFLVNQNMSYPEDKSLLAQFNILEKQLSFGENFHLLSGIPLFIHYYHRHEVLKEILIENKEPTTK